MASSKFYSYYLKGNKVAIIENNLADNDELKSPTSTVVSGLEIQYAYSPTYRLGSTGTEGTDFHRFLGWGSDGTNLLLFTYGASDVADLSSLFAADDWIYISGSGRWSGLHQVSATGGTKGVLTLKTRCNLSPSTIDVTGTFAISETFNGDSTAADMDIEAFKDAQAYRSTPYVFIKDAAAAANAGLFSLTADTTSGQLTLANKITIDADGDYTSAAAVNSAASSDAVSLYNAFYEQISVYEGVEILQDETFELDLNRYQANAVVYYLKAKLAEDTDEMEEREFFFREFKRQLEKGVSALKRGPYMIQGFKEMR